MTGNQTLSALGDVRGKRVLVRSDLNVPLDGATITDDGRIRASVPTIQALAGAGARVVVTAHLGRPKGAPEERYSLAPVAARLGELLGAEVAFATDTVGESAQAVVAGLADGQVALLENVRFNAGETSKDDAERGAFADQLAALADAFVSDGFGVVHRKQASVYDVAQRLPHAMGTLVAAEIDVLKRLTETPERPYAVVLGGSKVSDKLGVIDNLLGKADRLLIGGGMVFTFLKAQGHEVGKSLLEEDQIPVCLEYLKRAEETGVQIILPADIVVADAFGDEASARVVSASEIPAEALGLDIGPESGKAFAAALADAKTVFWNGPVGLFESKDFANGTLAVAKAMAAAKGAATVVVRPEALRLAADSADGSRLAADLVLSGRLEVPKTKGLTISGVTRWMSGAAFTIHYTNTDPDRNGFLFDPLPAGTYSGTGLNAITVESKGGRAGARGPTYKQTDMRFGYRLRPGGNGRTLDLFVEVFNIFNNANFENPTGDRRQADFLERVGSPRNVVQGRRTC